MRQSVVGGLLLAAATGLLILLSDPLSLNMEQYALFGVLLGGVLGWVADGAVWERLVGFGIGLVAAWVAYGLRAGFLPDSPAGRAVALGGLVAFLVLVVWLAGGRLRIVPMLVGAAAMAGAYEAAFAAAPPRFIEESVVALTGVLFAVAAGFAITLITSNWLGPEQRVGRHRPDGGDDHEADTEAETELALDDIFRRDQEAHQ